MKFDELFTKLKVNPLKLIESIVHADGSSVILFKNRKSEILYVNDQFIKNIHNLKIIRKQLLAKLILICFRIHKNTLNKL
mgnify:CR=1 FL=1